MVTRLIIARHGNTFNKGDVITRVGGRTDLPLVESGLEQGRMLGVCLAAEGLIPDKVYASPLKRAVMTAQKALEAMPLNLPIIEDKSFAEVDYGPDENKPEEEVLARIGQEAMDLWNTQAIVPNGWNVDPKAIVKAWKDFADSIKESNETVLVVTSNGTARFSIQILDQLPDVDIKLATGAYSVFIYENGKWRLDVWGVKPKHVLAEKGLL